MAFELAIRLFEVLLCQAFCQIFRYEQTFPVVCLSSFSVKY